MTWLAEQVDFEAALQSVCAPRGGAAWVGG